MEINSGALVNQGLIGMQRSQAEMVSSARQVASAATDNGNQDVVTPLVNIKAQATLFDSSARVVQTANETLGSLLDTRA